MSTSRRDAAALQLGQETVRYVASGQFKSRSPQTMGSDIRRLLNLMGLGNISFGSPQATWTIVREMVRQTLADLVESIRIYHISASFVNAPKEEYPLTVASVLFGRDDTRFADIAITDVNAAAARMIGTFAPRFVDVIPEQFRAEALPPAARPVSVATPRVEVTIPTEAIRQEIQELGSELRTSVSEGLVAGFDKLAATLPILIRGAPGQPPAAPYVAPPPAPAPVPAPSPTGEVPRTATQRTIFGERIAPAPVQGTLGGPLPPLAQTLEDKYRPLFLDDVLGNPTSVAVLRGAATSGNWGKLYLVTGRPGIGKTSAVLAAIRDYLLTRQGQYGTSLFNPSYSPSSPTFGISPSVLLYVNALSLVTRGGPQALIGDLARYTRTLGLPNLKKFAVIDDVTKFSKEQQQILLPLTERYPQVTFFMIANDPDYIEALSSRARHLRWSQPEPEEVEARLVSIIQHENLPFPDSVAEARRIVEGMGRNLEFRQAIIKLAADAAEVQGTRP
jgi:hypothetical protein